MSVRAETTPLSPLDVLKRENELLKQVRLCCLRKVFGDLSLR